MEQKQTNDEAIGCLHDMGDSIGRMLPVLLTLNTQGLQDASGIVENLWQSIENAKRIYLRRGKRGLFDSHLGRRNGHSNWVTVEGALKAVRFFF